MAQRKTIFIDLSFFGDEAQIDFVDSEFSAGVAMKCDIIVKPKA